MTSAHTGSATSSQAEDSGPSQLDWLDGPTIENCGPARVHVSRSRSRAREAVSTMLGICGPTSFASSVPDGPLSSWESRLRERLATVGSTECALIWREKDTPGGASISRLAPWTPPISDNASTGSHWPTPTVADVQGGRKTRSGSRSNEPLLNGLMTWSTPRASDGEKGGPNQSFGAGGQPMPAQMHQAASWVTPTTTLSGQEPEAWMAHRERMKLRHPTKGGMGTPLDMQMHITAATEAGGPITSGSSVTTAKRGAPNPAHPCWLMGFPAEWVSGASRAMRSRPSSRRKSSAR